MAQLQDIIAKRKELMGTNSNLSYNDAMAQARQQVAGTTPTVTPTPAPTTPVTPTQTTPTQTPQVVPPQPIPTPTQPDNWMGDFSQIKKKPFDVNNLPSQLTPEDQAKIDKMQAEGKFGQQNIETQPLQQTEFKPIDQTAKAKWIPGEAPVVNRQQEIQNNLATGYQTNPALFTDRAAYDKAYNYASKSPEEQATLDSFYNSKQPTISSMYSAIVNKQEVPDSTKMTPAYKIAQNRYSKANMYSSMTPTQVSQEMKNAKLIEGSQAFEDLKAINPKLVQDATNLRKVNGDQTNIWTTNKDGTVVNNLEKNIADEYTDNFGEFIKSMYKVYTPAEITAIIRTPDVVSAEDKALSIEKNINEIDKQLANVDSEVDTEFKGSGATGSRIAMEKASRRDVLNRDRDSQVREYTTYANRASNLINQNTVSFQTQQQQQQAQNAAMLPFITDQYKTAQAKKQAEFELNDPATQIKATMDEFTNLGIVAQGNIASKIEEFKKSGLSLPAYITQLRGQFMSKPEYKKIMDLKSGQLSDAQKMQMGQQYDLQKIGMANQFDLQKLGISNQQDIQRIELQYNLNNSKSIQDAKIDMMAKGATADQADSIIRNATGNWKGASGASLLMATDGTIIPSRLSETTNPNGGKECAEYVNDITGAGLGSTWESKKSKIDTTTPTVGNTAVWIPDPSNKNFAKYGHAGIITGIDGNNVTIKSSNLNGKGEISTITVPISQITKTGGFINTQVNGFGGSGTNSVDKEATLERIRRGQVTDSDLGKIQQKAVSGGWGADFTEALKKGMKSSMTDSQIKGLATVDDKIQKDTTLDNVNLVSQQKETIKGLLNTDINANGFNDIALINAFQKIVDPGVSVKEGDVSLLQSSIALKDKLNPSNLLSIVNAGTKLTPETRKQMLDSTVAIYNAQADFGNDLLQKRYYKLADNYGINLADYGYGYDKIDKTGKTSNSKLSSVMSVLEIANAPK